MISDQIVTAVGVAINCWCCIVTVVTVVTVATPGPDHGCRYNGDGGAAARPGLGPHPSQFSDLGPDYPIINVKIDTYNSY